VRQGLFARRFPRLDSLVLFHDRQKHAFDPAELRFSACQILKNENNRAIMADIHDLITPWPALLPAPGLRLNPPCNGGSAKRPKAPPPAPAPVRADSAEGEQASVAASRRQGLRKTIDPTSPLAPEPALGSLGKLGVGGLEGTMVNTGQPAPTPTVMGRGPHRVKW